MVKYSRQFRQVEGGRGQFAIKSPGNVAYCVRIRDGGSRLLTSGGWGPLVWSTVQAEFQPHEVHHWLSICEDQTPQWEQRWTPSAFKRRQPEVRHSHHRQSELSKSCLGSCTQSVMVSKSGVAQSLPSSLDAWSQPSILKPINYSETRVGSAGATFFSPKYKAEVSTPATAQITCILVVQTYWLVFPQDTAPQKVS